MAKTAGTDDDYDTDTISLTSTVPSEQLDQLYDVDSILAEGEALDGRHLYLVSWDGYPLHRSTWEPSENLEGTDLLQEWKKHRKDLGDAFEQYIQSNIDDFDAAEKAAKAQKALRQRKRAKKRKKLRNEASLGDSDSEDDRPLVSTRTRPSAQKSLLEDMEEDGIPIFVTQSRRPWRLPIDHPEGSSSSGDSDENLMDQIRQGAKKGGRNKASKGNRRRQTRQNQLRSSTNAAAAESGRSKGTPTTTKRTKTKENARGSLVGASDAAVPHSPGAKASTTSAAVPHSPGAKASTTSAAVPHNPNAKASTTSAKVPPPRIQTGTGTIVTKAASSAKAPLTSTATASAISDPPVSTTIASIKRTSTSRPIKMINEPPTASRKQWQNSEKHYNTLTMRGKALKRGREEQKPDETALQFVNGPPRGLPSAAASKSEARLADNVYSRRETGHRRRNSDDDEDGNKGKQETLWDQEANKIPLTCFEWVNGSCLRRAEQCRFHHTRGYPLSPFNGTVPGKYKTPPQTCVPWMEHPNGCVKSSEDCDFAHYNTGHLAQLGGRTIEIDPNKKPKSLSNNQAPARDLFPRKSRRLLTCFFWAQGNCRLSDERCAYAHWDTGEVAKPPGWVVKEKERERRERQNKSQENFPHGLISDQANGPSVELSPLPTAPTAGTDHDREAPLASTPAPQPTELEVHDNDLSPLDDPHPTQALATIPLKPAHLYAPAKIPCVEMKKVIENACELDFEKIFRHNNKDDGYLDRRAFLMFHPKDHMEELDLMARWLLIHHVEVCSLWHDGSWDFFLQKVLDGGTGVVFVHPDFADFQDVPNFGQILRSKVRIWSIGYQMAAEYDTQMPTVMIPPRYDCIEIFPHGGVIVITDDVFNDKPAEALRLISLFVNKANACGGVNDVIDSKNLVDEGILVWRIATRPDFMKSTFEWCNAHPKEIDAQDPAAQARASLYLLLSNCEYIEQDGPDDFMLRSIDYWPIMSERGDVWPEYYEGLNCSQTEATRVVIQHYSQWLLSLSRDYREIVVVHTEPQAVDWQQDFKHISEIMTPEQCIQYLEQPVKGNRFESYEWTFPSKKDSPGAMDIA